MDPVKRLRIDPVDGLAAVALAILATGVAMLSVPAALIVVGALLLVYAVLASRSEEGSNS